ncbi:ribokinase [Homoserinimonas hongtaonis]|nr:ribokinase [Salinibacterium hongtaonis]
MGQVCVVGSINLDLMVHIRHSPQVGETLLAESTHRLPGGKGFNQAVAATRSGATTRFCGRVGDDGDGAYLRAALVEAGLDASHLTVDESELTGFAHVAILPGSGNSIIVSPGANSALSAAAAVEAVEAQETPAVVLVQLEIPSATAEAALAAGRRLGAVTILNAAPPAGVTDSMLSQVDILIVNETEADALGGVDRMLGTDDGPGSVIVTLGSEGSLWVTRDGMRVDVRSFSVDPVDTTGAGDAFCGAFAAAISSGLDIPAAMQRASAAGAIVATQLGAQTTELSPEAIDRLVATRT